MLNVQRVASVANRLGDLLRSVSPACARSSSILSGDTPHSLCRVTKILKPKS